MISVKTASRSEARCAVRVSVYAFSAVRYVLDRQPGVRIDHGIAVVRALHRNPLRGGRLGCHAAHATGRGLAASGACDDRMSVP